MLPPEPWLLLDAATPRLVAAVRLGQRWAGSSSSTAAPTEAVGLATTQALAAAGLALSDLRGFVVDAGPGAQLGLRCAVLTVRTWLTLRPVPVAQYHSLALAALTAGMDEVLLAPAGRAAWWCLRPAAAGAAAAPPVRVEAPPSDGPVRLLAGLKLWQPAPPGAVPIELDPLAPALEPHWQKPGPWLTAAAEPAVFPAEAPTYVTWSGAIHRAPTP